MKYVLIILPILIISCSSQKKIKREHTGTVYISQYQYQGLKNTNNKIKQEYWKIERDVLFHFYPDSLFITVYRAGDYFTRIRINRTICGQNKKIHFLDSGIVVHEYLGRYSDIVFYENYLLEDIEKESYNKISLIAPNCKLVKEIKL